jgi:hypothetical protein
MAWWWLLRSWKMLPNFKSYFKLWTVIQDCCVRQNIPFLILGIIYTQRYGTFTIENSYLFFILSSFQYLFPYLRFPLYTFSVLRPAVCSSYQHTITTRSCHFLLSTKTFLSRCLIWTNDPGMAAIESPMDRRPAVKMWPVMLQRVFCVLLSFLTWSNCKATLPQVIHDSIKITLSIHYWRRVCEV